MRLFDQNGKLDLDVQDALYELGNVGVGMASVTIGKLLGVRVELATPNVVPVGDIVSENLLGDEENDNVGIWMKFKEPLKGSVLFLMNNSFMQDVVECMTGKTYGDEQERIYEDELGFSAMTEFANMLAAAYMRAIGKYTGIRIYMSPVLMVFNREKVSLEKLLEKQGTEANMAIWIETSFQLLDDDGNKTCDVGRVVMLPDDDTVVQLLEALGL